MFEDNIIKLNNLIRDNSNIFVGRVVNKEGSYLYVDIGFTTIKVLGRSNSNEVVVIKDDTNKYYVLPENNTDIKTINSLVISKKRTSNTELKRKKILDIETPFIFMENDLDSLKIFGYSYSGNILKLDKLENIEGLLIDKTKSIDSKFNIYYLKENNIVSINEKKEVTVLNINSSLKLNTYKYSYKLAMNKYTVLNYSKVNILSIFLNYFGYYYSHYLPQNINESIKVTTASSLDSSGVYKSNVTEERPDYNQEYSYTIYSAAIGFYMGDFLTYYTKGNLLTDVPFFPSSLFPVNSINKNKVHEFISKQEMLIKQDSSYFYQGHIYGSDVGKNIFNLIISGSYDYSENTKYIEKQSYYINQEEVKADKVIQLDIVNNIGFTAGGSNLEYYPYSLGGDYGFYLEGIDSVNSQLANIAFARSPVLGIKHLFRLDYSCSVNFTYSILGLELSFKDNYKQYSNVYLQNSKSTSGSDKKITILESVDKRLYSFIYNDLENLVYIENIFKLNKESSFTVNYLDTYEGANTQYDYDQGYVLKEGENSLDKEVFKEEKENYYIYNINSNSSILLDNRSFYLENGDKDITIKDSYQTTGSVVVLNNTNLDIYNGIYNLRLYQKQQEGYYNIYSCKGNLSIETKESAILTVNEFSLLYKRVYCFSSLDTFIETENRTKSIIDSINLGYTKIINYKDTTYFIEYFGVKNKPKQEIEYKALVSKLDGDKIKIHKTISYDRLVLNVSNKEDTSEVRVGYYPLNLTELL